MKRTLSILFVLGLSIGVFGLYDWADRAENVRAQSELLGDLAPAFTLDDVNGNEVSSEAFNGKVVVLDFWAVWCGPCQVSLPYFQSLADKYGRKGLEVVGLHVDDRRPPVQDIKDYLAARKVTYTNLVSTVEVDDDYQVYAMPTTYLVDREGRIRKVHVGFDPSTAPEEIEKEILVLLERR